MHNSTGVELHRSLRYLDNNRNWRGMLGELYARIKGNVSYAQLVGVIDALGRVAPAGAGLFFSRSLTPVERGKQVSNVKMPSSREDMRAFLDR